MIAAFSVQAAITLDGAGAATTPLTSAEIGVYQAKVAHANETRASLVSRIDCLDKQDGALVADRNDKQLRLSGLLKQVSAADAEVSQAAALIPASSRNFYDAQSRLQRSQRQYNDHAAQLKQKQAERADCLEKWK